jgi:hypothetical protein
VTTAPCTWIAPFGVPVVPLVKCSSDGSSGMVRSTSAWSDAAAISAARSSVPGTSVAPPSSATSSTCLSDGMASRTLATLRSYSASVVTSTAPWPMLMRVAIGSGPKAEKSGVTTVPFFSAPSTAT